MGYYDKNIKSSSLYFTKCVYHTRILNAIFNVGVFINQFIVLYGLVGYY